MSTPTVLLISGVAGCQGHGRVYLHNLAAQLQASGRYRVAVVAPRGSGLDAELSAVGVQVHNVDVDFGRIQADRFRRFRSAAGLARGLTRLAVNIRFLLQAVDIAREYSDRGVKLVCHFLDYEYISLAVALERLGGLGCKTAVTLHPSDFRQPGLSLAAVYKRGVRHLLEYAAPDAFFCHGEWIADRLASQLRLGATRLHHFPYAAQESAPKLQRDEARRTLGLAPHVERWILWYGMIRRNKRIDVAIDALSELPHHYGLLIVGNPTEVSREEVLHRVKARGLEGRVHLELRYVDDAELGTWFGAADVLLATHDASFTSASGPVADARAYGLPVVVSDVGELSNYVQTYRVGRVAKPDAPVDYARALCSLLDDDDALGACQAAVERAAVELSWSAFARQHARMYDEILGHGNSHAGAPKEQPSA